jgi:maleylacetoacetate isomerase
MSEASAEKKRPRVERTLLNYWRSSCSWRVRLALAHKKLDYEYKAINLLKGEDSAPEYYAMNPAGVPTLIDDGQVFVQSLAIMEFLEEKYPDHPLLPRSFHQRSLVRAVCLQIVSGVQPLQNLGVLNRIGGTFGDAAKTQWAKDVIDEGMQGFEELLKRTAGRYCVGDEFTMADCCLIPQGYACRRFGVDPSKYPTVGRVLANLETLDIYHATHPDRMPDAVKA